MQLVERIIFVLLDLHSSVAVEEVAAALQPSPFVKDATTFLYAGR